MIADTAETEGLRVMGQDEAACLLDLLTVFYRLERALMSVFFDQLHDEKKQIFLFLKFPKVIHNHLMKWLQPGQKLPIPKYIIRKDGKKFHSCRLFRELFHRILWDIQTAVIERS